jgi:AraC family transcriptional regulator
VSSSSAEHLDAGQFFGRTTTSRAVFGMAISETAYRPSLVIPRHDHELANICLVIEGSYDETFGRRQRVCSPGMAIFHPAGEHHADVHHGAAVTLLSIELADERLRELQAVTPVLKESAHLEGREAGWAATRLAREFHRSDSASALAIEALVLELLVLGQRRALDDGAAPAWLGRVREYLHAHFAEQLSLQQLAREAGVHPAHLARVFRRHQRCSIGGYVRRLRLEAAQRQLAESELPLAEIAVAAGFSDQSHFSRLIRAETGLTPTQYRRANRRFG